MSCSRTQSGWPIVFIKILKIVDFKLKKVLPPDPHPIGNLADISFHNANFKLRRIKDVCTLCAWVLVSESMLHILPFQIKKKK